MNKDMESLRNILGKARRICVLTGAGVSAESGVPTFRGDAGIWKNHNPMDLATPQAFDRDPELVWEFYAWRRMRMREVAPNPAHFALAALERIAPHFTLITQNVDGLHQSAGSENVLEIHGSIWTLRCPHCGAEEENREPDLPPLPRCADCGGLLRPGVVWFGEPLDARVWDRAVTVISECEVFLSVGTSALVQPAASLALAAQNVGAVTAEVNPEPTEQTEAMDYAFTGKAGILLPGLVPEQNA